MISAVLNALGRNQLAFVKRFGGDSSDPDFAAEGKAEFVDSVYDANLVTSRLGDGKHSVVLDIDIPAMLVPSTTFGHSHLYIDKTISWEQYTKLLDVLAEVGIVEPGYVEASKARGFTAVRLPWIPKEGA